MSEHTQSEHAQESTSAFLKTDYFALFGFLPNFEISADDLTKKYFGLQRQFHPDRIQQSRMDHVTSTMVSSRINAAYETLRCPFKRACYLMELREIKLPFDEQQTIQDPDFLLEMMDLRERIASAQNHETKHILANEISSLIEHGLSDFQSAFKSHDHPQAIRCLIKIYYWIKAKDLVL